MDPAIFDITLFTVLRSVTLHIMDVPSALPVSLKVKTDEAVTPLSPPLTSIDLRALAALVANESAKSASDAAINSRIRVDMVSFD